MSKNSYVALRVPSAGGSVRVTSGAQDVTTLTLYSIVAFPVPSYSTPRQIAYTSTPATALSVPEDQNGRVILALVSIDVDEPVSFEISVPNDEAPIIDVDYLVRTAKAGVTTTAPLLTVVDLTPPEPERFLPPAPPGDGQPPPPRGAIVERNGTEYEEITFPHPYPASPSTLSHFTFVPTYSGAAVINTSNGRDTAILGDGVSADADSPSATSAEHLSLPLTQGQRVFFSVQLYGTGTAPEVLLTLTPPPSAANLTGDQVPAGQPFHATTGVYEGNPFTATTTGTEVTYYPLDTDYFDVISRTLTLSKTSGSHARLYATVRRVRDSVVVANLDLDTKASVSFELNEKCYVDIAAQGVDATGFAWKAVVSAATPGSLGS